MKKQWIFGILAMCMFVLLCSCAGISPETVAKEYAVAITQQDVEKLDEVCAIPVETIIMNNLDKQYSYYTEEDMLKKASEDIGLDRVARNRKELYTEFKKWYTEFMQDRLTEDYGEGYKIKSAVVRVELIEGSDMWDVLEEASDYYAEEGIILTDVLDFTKIKACQQITCKVYISSKTNNDETEMTIPAIKINGNWKILNMGYQ